MATAQTNHQSTDIVVANPTNAWNYFEVFEKSQAGGVSKAPTNNILVMYLPDDAIMNLWSANVFDSSKAIYFGFALTTNKYSVILALKPEYGFRMSAVTENGEPVSPTSKGSRYGKSFDQLKGFDKKAIDPTRNVPHYSYMPHFCIVGPTNETPSFEAIATPDELFNFTKPGKYTMTIETACFAKGDYMPNINSSTTNYSLVKFPPVRLQVIKKDNGK